MKALGLDLGIDSTGWCVVEEADGLARCLAAGSFSSAVRGYEGSGMRPFRFRQAVKALIIEYQPDVVVYELVTNHKRYAKGKTHDQTGASHVYGMLQGALLEVCDRLGEVPCTTIGVSEWKQEVAGKGNASKEAVAEVIERMPGWPWPPHLAGKRYPLDVTDAAGIALGWLKLESKRIPFDGRVAK